MKGLKKIALASAIAAVAAGAQAELKALDDSTMSEMTGQAGLTIDLETKWSIGEFAYQDAGFLVLRDLKMGGNSNEDATQQGYSSMLDNIRMEIDIAGADADPSDGASDAYLKYGFSNVKNLAAIHTATALNNNPDADLIELSKGSLLAAALKDARFTGISRDGVGGDIVDNEVAYGDGDLKIHFTFTDAWQKGGGFEAFKNGQGKSLDGTVTNLSLANVSYEQARDIATSSVDFEFSIGQIGLASSGYDYGRVADLESTDHVTGADADTTTTVLISDLSIKGYLGPADIHIENKGNGFGADGSGQVTGFDASGNATLAAGTGNADSKIHWDSYFKVTDLDVYIDIAGVQIKDLSIHNDRGDTTGLNQIAVGVDGSGNPIFANTGSFGFAHSKRDIYAVKDAVLDVGAYALTLGAGSAYVDGIAINTRFKGDIDIGHLSFGNTNKSIGSIYITDKTATTNWTISAH